MRGPYNTAQLFFELKQGRDEPSAEVASSIGQTPNEDYTDRYNAAIEDFMSKLPGVTSKNKAAVLNRGSSLPALCKLSEQELCSLVENTTLGNALYKALHTRPEVISGSLVTRTKKHQRFRATKAAANSEQELCSLVENTTLGNALYKALHTRPEVSSGSLVSRTEKHQRFRATKAAAKK
ncbi:DNA repair endonuclease XPF-like [Diaphorina citri]|uniref:DNA repair endonuclease XPF-like n=1 Tax=Diaphorina citri TaxID=121845 RepID=A0A3Q0IPX6_DIACI|nr:DNA repair endonuclease XPF-like [Diaphorina citri]